MNRLLTTAAVLIALTVPAYAGPRGPFYPPPEYDHAFAGETIVVKDWDQDVLRSMGCSVKNVPRGIKVTVAGVPKLVDTRVPALYSSPKVQSLRSMAILSKTSFAMRPDTATDGNIPRTSVLE